MIGFLRFLGVANAAVWFGAAIFFTLGIGPGLFSGEMEKLFGDAGFRYYAGGVALVLIRRYFILQGICGLIALCHLSLESLYFGRKPDRWMVALLVSLFCLALAGGLWMRPKMMDLRQTMYFGATAAQKEQARHSFGVWHAVSQFTNLLVIVGLAVHLSRVTRPPIASRYGASLAKFRS